MGKIDDIVKKERDHNLSLMRDWQLAEAYVLELFRSVSDEDVLSGFDPAPREPVMVELEPDGLSQSSSQLESVKIYCPTCKARTWKQNITQLRKRILESIHDPIIRGPDDSGESMNDIIEDAIEAEVTSDPYRCPHAHSVAYARLTERKRQELESVVRSLVYYRARMRHTFKQLKMKAGKPDPNRKTPVDAAIRQFKKRQTEIEEEIAQGDASIRQQYRSLKRDEIDADINASNPKAEPAFSIKPEVADRLRTAFQEWHSRRADLRARLWLRR